MSGTPPFFNAHLPVSLMGQSSRFLVWAHTSCPGPCVHQQALWLFQTCVPSTDPGQPRPSLPKPLSFFFNVVASQEHCIFSSHRNHQSFFPGQTPSHGASSFQEHSLTQLPSFAHFPAWPPILWISCPLLKAIFLGVTRALLTAYSGGFFLGFCLFVE